MNIAGAEYIPVNQTAPFAGAVTFLQTHIHAASHYVSTHLPISLEALLLLLPFIVGAVRALWPFVRIAATDALARHRGSVTRTIAGTICGTYQSDALPKDRNVLLQNAIFLYLAKEAWAKRPPPASAWYGKPCAMLLVDPFRSRVYEGYQSAFYVNSSSSDSDDDDSDGGGSGNDLAFSSIKKKKLERLVLVKLPTDYCTVEAVPGVLITYRRQPSTVGSTPAIERFVILSARGRNAAQAINQFVEDSLNFYLSQLPKLKSSEGRRFYELQPGGGLKSKSEEIVFKQFPLTAEKNFDTLFFPERERVMKMVDDFMLRRGRFAVEGFPYKLGFLLHGPPGTGKTAFVKALAAYTGRHVVSIPLGLVETNQQLYDIFLNRSYQCVGESEKQRVEMEDAIFLLDDVDASSPLVCSRQRVRTVHKRRHCRLTARDGGNSSSSGDVAAAAGSAAHSEEEGEEEDDGQGEGEEGAKKTGSGSDGSDDDDVHEHVVELFERKAPRLADMLGGAEGGGGSGGGATPPPAPVSEPSGFGFGGGAMGPKKSLLSMFETADQLDLSGLLNVLDGVVDTPGRIIVMVTSRPEWLDPALVRPGRMSVRIRMDYARMPALLRLAGLHFGDVAPPPGVTVDTLFQQLERERGAEAAAEEREGEGGGAAAARVRVRDVRGLVPDGTEDADDSASDDDAGAAVEDEEGAVGPDGKRVKGGPADEETKRLRELRRALAERARHKRMRHFSTGAAAARLPTRTLSAAQEQRVRAAVAALEAEHAACGDAESRRRFNFRLAPSEVQMLCAATETLDEFIEQLTKVIRGEQKM